MNWGDLFALLGLWVAGAFLFAALHHRYQTRWRR